jgi:hypothetical protein
MVSFLLSACGCPTYKVNISNRPGVVDYTYNDANYISTERSTKNIASCKGKVHIAWFGRNSSGQTAVFYRRSTNGGVSWDPALQLTPFVGNLGLEMWVQCYGDTVVVAYEKVESDNNIYYRYSTNGGNTWSSEALLRGGSNNQEAPSIWIWGNNFHLAWSDNTPPALVPVYYVWYGRSTTLGSSWVSSGRRDLSDSPIIVGDPTNPNRLHIIFMIFNTLEKKARYIRSTDGGSTWSSTFDLSNGVNAGGSGFWARPIGSISAYGNYVHAVFVDERYGNKEVLYRRSTDAGATWSAITNLSNTSDTSWSPYILTNNAGEVRVYWVDKSDGDYEILCKISTDNGSSWSANDRLTNNTAKDVMVSLDYDPTNSRWHIVWSSNEGGDWEVYYTSDPCPTSSDDDLGVAEEGEVGGFRIWRDGIILHKDAEVRVFDVSGKLYVSGKFVKGEKVRLKRGVWFILIDGKIYRAII